MRTREKLWQLEARRASVCRGSSRTASPATDRRRLERTRFDGHRDRPLVGGVGDLESGRDYSCFAGKAAAPTDALASVARDEHQSSASPAKSRLLNLVCDSTA
jgi:hypothetical protein